MEEDGNIINTNIIFDEHSKSVCVWGGGGESWPFLVLRACTSRRTMHKRINSFEPLDKVNNGNFDILIGDESNNLVHITDFHGNFIRYIEYPCNGGTSVDSDHNLVVGETTTGNIPVIKYLE